MIPSLIILVALVVAGLVLYAHHRLTDGDLAEPGMKAPAADESLSSGDADAEGSDPEVCCGMHEVCEKFRPAPHKPVYYDDEELDVFVGRTPESYTDDETELFRDVLLTLLPHDVYGWQQSIEARGIALPECVHDELMLRLTEND